MIYAEMLLLRARHSTNVYFAKLFIDHGLATVALIFYVYGKV